MAENAPATPGPQIPRPAPGADPVAAPVEECHRCGAAIAPGETRCPECGSHLYRECFCGWHIPVTAERCPRCGADWSGALRTRKRVRSHRVHAARLGASAVGGSLAALILAALLGIIIRQLALRALPEGDTTLPDGLTARLGLAWQGLIQLGALMGRHLAEISQGLWIVLLIVFAGAVVGAVFYLVREDLLRLPRAPWGHKKGRHYRRRRAR